MLHKVVGDENAHHVEGWFIIYIMFWLSAIWPSRQSCSKLLWLCNAAGWSSRCIRIDGTIPGMCMDGDGSKKWEGRSVGGEQGGNLLNQFVCDCVAH